MTSPVIGGHERSRPPAIAVMARSPRAAGKSRLAPALSPERHAELRLALLSDALATVRASALPAIVFVVPDSGSTESMQDAASGFEVEVQRGADLGERMANAVADVCRRGHRGAIVIGTDAPLLTAAHLYETRACLAPGRVVFGPAHDGGYYLVALTEDEPRMFEGISWGTAGVLVESMAAAARVGLAVHLMPSLDDVDTAGDLDRVREALASAPAHVAPALRHWLRGGEGQPR